MIPCRRLKMWVDKEIDETDDNLIELGKTKQFNMDYLEMKSYLNGYRMCALKLRRRLDANNEY